MDPDTQHDGALLTHAGHETKQSIICRPPPQWGFITFYNQVSESNPGLFYLERPTSLIQPRWVRERHRRSILPPAVRLFYSSASTRPVITELEWIIKSKAKCNHISQHLDDLYIALCPLYIRLLHHMCIFLFFYQTVFFILHFFNCFRDAYFVFNYFLNLCTFWNCLSLYDYYGKLISLWEL